MQFNKMQPKDPGAPLMVVSIGRISTEYQQETNIQAGQDYGERVIKDVYDGPALINRFGEQGSGMLVERETIMAALREIQSGRYDLVVLEDVSRAYRNPRWIYAFVQDCVDLEVRVIATGDGLDTWDDNWEVNLGAAALRHGMHIPDTRRRVRRTASHAFEHGGMVGKIRYGYRKLTPEEADSGTFGPKGLRLARVPETTPVMQELHRRVVIERHGGALLAEWLNESHVPVPRYCKQKRWSPKLVLSLLRDPILYGLRQYPKVRHLPRFSDGKHKRVKNANPQRTQFAELAHLSEEHWREMNRVLDELGARCGRTGGRDHPRYRVRRKDSVTPLQHARCAVCNSLFYLATADGAKCKNALKHSPDGCWNHVQISCVLVREKIVDLLLAHLDRNPLARKVLLEAAWEAIDRARGRLHNCLDAIDKEIADLEKQASRLSDAIAEGGEMKSLLQKLKAMEKLIAQAQKRRREHLQEHDGERLPPTPQALEIEPRSALLELAGTSFEFGELMRKLFPRFLIQPVQALDCGQVHPRGLLTLDWSAIHEAGRKEQAPPAEELQIDFFESPVHIKHLTAVVALRAERRQQGLKASLKVLSIELRLHRMTVKRALDYHKLMLAAGLSEPYRVLTERPASASRWKPRQRDPVTSAAA